MKWVILVSLIFLSACAVQFENPEPSIPKETPADVELKTATFSGGCFWCMEAPFEKLDGVYNVTSGFAGGEEENPEYKEVASGRTGHREAVQMKYNPEKISYDELLDVFWRQVDPTDDGGQFVDRGFQYSTAIFTHDEEQKATAEKSKSDLDASNIYDKAIVTPIIPFTTFYPAEEYHQDYYKKSSLKYKYYRSRSGRDQFLDSVWPDESTEEVTTNVTEEKYSKPSQEEIKEMLTELQYKVTQKNGTERAFHNEYWNNTEPGIYVDIVSGEPLFSSVDKYKSGTGWPSFTKPLVSENIVQKKDFLLIIPRTEIRSKHGDSHIGHVFKDGPEPTGLRYCMNSAAMKFIPADNLEAEGYGEFSDLFNE